MSALLAALLLATPAGGGGRPSDELLGALGVHVVTRGESLIELAPLYGVGFNEIAAANPDLDPFIPRAGSIAVIPTAWILPAAAAPGTIVVNLSEMRLYYAPSRARPPLTFPIGVAVEAGATPLGVLKVVEKSVLPTWYPTPAMLEEDPTLPAAVPPGPENPLGTHALRLSRRTILIHGTNRPLGIGRKVSQGCVRLYPDDIRRLYRAVEIGTRVVIVREPVKVAVSGDRVYVEVHEDDALALDPLEEALRLLRERAVLHRVDPRKLARAVLAKRGIPVRVGTGPK